MTIRVGICLTRPAKEELANLLFTIGDLGLTVDQAMNMDGLLNDRERSLIKLAIASEKNPINHELVFG